MFGCGVELSPTDDCLYSAYSALQSHDADAAAQWGSVPVVSEGCACTLRAEAKAPHNLSLFARLVNGRILSAKR